MRNHAYCKQKSKNRQYLPMRCPCLASPQIAGFEGFYILNLLDLEAFLFHFNKHLCIVLSGLGPTSKQRPRSPSEIAILLCSREVAEMAKAWQKSWRHAVKRCSMEHPHFNMSVNMNIDVYIYICMYVCVQYIYIYTYMYLICTLALQACLNVPV